MRHTSDIYNVAVPRVPGVSRARMQSYIKEAVATWGGQLAPDDPLGPPCPLMVRGAVKVFAEPRNGVVYVAQKKGT